MNTAPNKALQRTRFAPLRSPLSFKPLGGGSSLGAKVAALALLIMGMAQGSAVVWTKPGELRVVVVARDGLPIPGVTVELLSVPDAGSHRNAVSDSKGRAGFVGVGPGEYALKFQLSGFATCSIGPITMRSEEHGNPQLPEFVVMMNPVMWVG